MKFFILDDDSRVSFVRKSHKTVREWIDNKNNRDYYEFIINSFDNIRSVENVYQSSLHLNLVGEYFRTLGGYELLYGDKSKGLLSLKKSFHYCYLSLSANLSFQKEKGSFSTWFHGEVNSILDSLILMCFLDKRSYAELTLEYLLTLEKNNVFLKMALDRPYYDFVKWICSAYLGKDFGSELLVGPYKNIVEKFSLSNDNDASEKKQACNEMLDYLVYCANELRGYSALHKDHYEEYIYSSAFDKESMMLFPLSFLLFVKINPEFVDVFESLGHPLVPTKNFYWMDDSETDQVQEYDPQIKRLYGISQNILFRSL